MTRFRKRKIAGKLPFSVFFRRFASAQERVPKTVYLRKRMKISTVPGRGARVSYRTMFPKISVRWSLLEPNFRYLSPGNEGEKCLPLDHFWQILFIYSIRIGSHMISSAMWNKEARAPVHFSKNTKIAPARRASAIWGLWKICKCLFFPNWSRKFIWLLVNNIRSNFSDKQLTVCFYFALRG